MKTLFCGTSIVVPRYETIISLRLHSLPGNLRRTEFAPTALSLVSLPPTAFPGAPLRSLAVEKSVRPFGAQRSFSVEPT
jgi:hypothetical protein